MTDEHDSAAPGPAPRRKLPVTAVVIVAVAFAFAGGLLVGSRLTGGPVEFPAEDSVDAGFARDMQTHHRQAVQMSTFVLDESDDADVVILARDIQLTQQQQSGQLYGWLVSWGLRQSSLEPVMAWATDDPAAMTGMAGMDGMQHDVDMPGLATAAQLERLEQAVGGQADRLYLQLMIPHHEGGVAMAEVAARRAADPAVRRLAQTIVNSQTSELTVLRDMLAARGGPVGDE